MAVADDCIFCKIVRGEIPSTKMYETENVYAFADLKPMAKVHALVVPKKHYDNVVELAADNPQLLAEMVEVGSTIAQEKYNGQFRIEFNTGTDAGQSVFHCHMHALTGEKLEGE